MGEDPYKTVQATCGNCKTEWEFHIREPGSGRGERPILCPECDNELTVDGLPITGDVMRQLAKRGSKWVQVPLDVTG